MKPSPVSAGVWVRVRPSAASTFVGRRGIVCSLHADKRAAMVLLVGERKPLSFGVRELEVATLRFGEQELELVTRGQP